MATNLDDPLGSADTLAPEPLAVPAQPVDADTGLLPRDAPLTVRQLGRYLVLGRIGSGGMGVVYRAFDPQLDRKVAIKLLRTEAGTNEARARLLREAQAMARLSHPNVVAVHDVGILDEQIFIAMELVEGQTLGQWMKTDHTWRDALTVFVPAARGLAAAHAAGLVHRDFKPDNVLIDERGRVCVLDFGLARPVESPLDDPLFGDDHDALPVSPEQPTTSLGHALTRTGALMGTPAYMAPEQLRRQPTSPRSDQFSFCVALYQALYGERPFAGESVDELAPNLLGGKVRPAPPDSRVPKRLRQVVLRGLRTNPDERFPSMDALVADLLHDADAQRRRTWGVAALVGFGGLSLFAVARTVHRDALSCRDSAEKKLADSWGARQKSALERAFAHVGTPYAHADAASTSAALDDYAQRWAAVRVDACEATRLRGEQSAELLDLRMSCLDRRAASLKALVDLLLTADGPMVDRALAAVEQLPDLAVCSDAAALRSPVHPPTDPQARARIADAQTQLAAASALSQAGRYTDAARAATALLPTVEQLGHRPLQAEALLVAAAAEAGAGDFKAAEQHFTDAALAAEAGRDDASAALAWARLTMVVGYDQARYADGLAWARHARASIERLGGNPRAEALLLTAEGTIYVEEGQPDLAQPAHERALALDEKLFGADSAEVASTLLHLGFDYFSRGQLDRALAAYQRSLAIREKKLGAHHPLCATSLINVGNVYYQKRDLAQAATCYQRALTIQEASLGPNHASLASSLNNLGNVFSDQKDWARAAAAYTRALAIDEHALGPNHPSLATPIANLGDVYLGQGRTDEALTQYERSLALLTKAHGADHPSLARPLTGVGEAYLKAHASVKAVAPLERALALRLAHPVDPLDVAATRYDLAQAIGARDPARARALATAAHAAIAAAGPEHASDAAEIDAFLKSIHKESIR